MATKPAPVFRITTTDAKGRIKIFTSTPGGGGLNMEAEHMLAFARKHNQFPKAKKIVVELLDRSVSAERLKQLEEDPSAPDTSGAKVLDSAVWPPEEPTLDASKPADPKPGEVSDQAALDAGIAAGTISKIEGA